MATTERPPQILLVDDESIVVNTLVHGLSALGYQVTGQESAQQALLQYQQQPPDLVITDYRMPEMNGVELARRMIEVTHRPIIMLSAFNDLPLVREAVDVGISAYLVKPVEAERIAPSIEAALARFSEIRALIQQGDNMQAGLETQRLISTAVGIVMAKSQLSQDVAFESLRRLARNQRRALRELAYELVDASSTVNSVISQLSNIKLEQKK